MPQAREAPDPPDLHLLSRGASATLADPAIDSPDITALVLGLARPLPPEDMAERVAALVGRVAARGDPRLEALVFDRVGTMLQLRNYTGRLKLGGAKTMDEMAERFERGLDELVERGAREGRVMVLRRQIARRFGEETAGRVSGVLDGPSGPDAIDALTDALFECGTGEEFVERVGTG